MVSEKNQGTIIISPKAYLEHLFHISVDFMFSEPIFNDTASLEQ